VVVPAAARVPQGKRVTFSTEPPVMIAAWRRRVVAQDSGMSEVPVGETHRQAQTLADGLADMGLVVATSAPEAPLRASRAGGQATLRRYAGTGPVTIPSAPEADARDWHEWRQAERAQGLVDLHARMTEMRARRQCEPKCGQPRTLG
jgi:hypothetical protein